MFAENFLKPYPLTQPIEGNFNLSQIMGMILESKQRRENFSIRCFDSYKNILKHHFVNIVQSFGSRAQVGLCEAVEGCVYKIVLFC